MRFRANIKDVNALLPTLQAFLSSGTIGLFVLSPATTRIILPAEHTTGEQLYAELDTSVWASDCKVESQHENKIPFLVYLPNVVRALQSALRSEVATLKLTKRNNRAYLTCDTQTPDAHVTHDIPIIVQSVKKLDDWEEPLLDDPRVKLVLPDLSALAALTDKMKNVSDVLDIEASSDGILTLSAEQSMVKIKSTYNGLKILQPALSDRSSTPSSLRGESPAQNQIAHALSNQPQQQQQQMQPQQEQQQQMGGGIVATDGLAAMELDGAAGGAGGGGGVGVGPSVSLSALNSAIDGTQPPDGVLQPALSASPLGGAAAPPPASPLSTPAIVERASCRVSMKKFANITGAKHVQTLHALGCIVEDAAFVVYLKLKNKRGIITYYLPLIQA